MSQLRVTLLSSKKFKLVSLFLMMLVLLVSCAGPSTQTSEAPAASNTQPSAAEAPKSAITETNASQPVTIELWDYLSPDKIEAWWQTFIADYQNTHPGVTINRIPYAEKDYDNALRTAIAAGQPPDILYLITGMNLYDYAESGTIIPIDGLVDTSIYTPGLITSLSHNGAVYAVPRSVEPTLFWYNVKLFEENNVNPPKTWDELLSMCDTFNKAKIIPISLAGIERWQASMFYQPLVYQTGGYDLIDKAGRGEVSWTDPAFIKAGDYLVQMADRGCFPSNLVGMDYTAGFQAFVNGDAAAEVMGSWIVQGVRDAAAPDFDLSAFLLPIVPDALPSTEVNMELGVAAFAITANSKHSDVAADFLNVWGENSKSYSEAGFLPVVPGATVQDPASKVAIELMGGTKVTYTWADRRLPGALMEDYLNNLTAMLIKQITPLEFGQKMDEAVKSKVTP